MTPWHVIKSTHYRTFTKALNKSNNAEPNNTSFVSRDRHEESKNRIYQHSPAQKFQGSKSFSKNAEWNLFLEKGDKKCSRILCYHKNLPKLMWLMCCNQFSYLSSNITFKKQGKFLIYWKKVTQEKVTYRRRMRQECSLERSCSTQIHRHDHS